MLDGPREYLEAFCEIVASVEPAYDLHAVQGALLDLVDQVALYRKRPLRERARAPCGADLV
jgi:hypothetical protein